MHRGTRRRLQALCASTCIALATHVASACTCEARSVAEELAAADAVFAGTVTNVVEVDSREDVEPRIVVSFEVARAWKGDVGPQFTLHTNYEFSSCSGMWREMAKPGESLVVFAYRQAGKEWTQGVAAGAANARSYTVMGEPRRPVLPAVIESIDDSAVLHTTNICTLTGTVRLASEVFDQLGPAREFAPLRELPDRQLLASLQPMLNALPGRCGELTDGKLWQVPARVPDEAGTLRALVAAHPMLALLRAASLPPQAEYWVTGASGHVGLCRVSLDPGRVCGNQAFSFAQADGQWRIVDGSVSTWCD